MVVVVHRRRGLVGGVRERVHELTDERGRARNLWVATMKALDEFVAAFRQVREGHPGALGLVESGPVDKVIDAAADAAAVEDVVHHGHQTILLVVEVNGSETGGRRTVRDYRRVIKRLEKRNMKHRMHPTPLWQFKSVGNFAYSL